MSKILYILLTLYLITISIQLYFCCCSEDSLGRKISKIFLMPLLGSLYYFGTSKDKFSKNVLLGIIFGFIGDVFLLSEPYSPLIKPGIFTFFIGHVLYIISYIRETGYHNYKKYFIVLLIYSSIFIYGGTFAFKYLKDGFRKGNMMFPGVCYLAMLMILNTTANFYAFTYFNKYTLIICLGSFIFFVSDFILVRKMFYEENRYYQIVLMATYILAQSLICYGLAHRKSRFKLTKTN